jgi:hypothetical protein
MVSSPEIFGVGRRRSRIIQRIPGRGVSAILKNMIKIKN